MGKPLRDATGDGKETWKPKVSHDHIAGDLSRLLGSLCCSPCWYNMRLWLVSMMFIGMGLAVALIISTVHDLDLLRQYVEEPKSLSVSWLRPWLLSDPSHPEAIAVLVCLGLGWIITGSVWTWTCSCHCCHRTQLWQAMDSYLWWLWFAGICVFAAIVFAVIVKRSKDKVKDIIGARREKTRPGQGSEPSPTRIGPPPLPEFGPGPPPPRQFHVSRHGWSGYSAGGRG